MAEKKYIVDNADLMAEWNWEKNKELGLEPQKISYGSAKKVWWKCQKGHEWEISPNLRSSGNGCPYCAGQKVLKGYNDLQTINPILAKEWNYEKNNGLTPMDVMPNSSKKVWWKCSKGHEWQAKIQNRNRGYGCPYCSGRYAVKGDSDLQTVNPSLAKEWHYEKNDGLTPMDVKPNSDKKVWWKCNKGHEWQATIKHRSNGQNCPICNSERHTSLPEYALVYYLKKYGVEVLQSYKEQGYELDVYIPAKRIAIEYDGSYWHRNKTKMDLEKNSKCRKDGIKLYRIREGLPSLNDTSIDYLIQDNKKDLSTALKEILSEILQASVDIDLESDALYIENLREYTEKESSLLVINPTLSKQWNYEKNGKLKPENFTANNTKKVWWKCSKDHEWQATIASRNKGIGCPYCSGRYAIKGENDLQTVNPILAKEWNFEKNNRLMPTDVMPNSNKKAWWKCSKGHEWQAAIDDRNRGNGCPFCAGQKVLKGYNDLQTINPILAKEWGHENNNGLTPMDVSPNSHKKVWWKCNQGHEWQATISNRNIGRGCPYCTSKKVLKGYNDLQTVNPTLVKEWNYEKNNGLTPADVTPNSHAKVWWKCNQGHEWQATIGNRNIGRGCPFCSGRTALSGYNDLQTSNPTLANEWNFEKNGDSKPENFTANSGEKVWWKCSKSHEWEATIDSRNRGAGCPYCSGRYAIKGENDLQTVNPTLAKEWNYEKNDELTPMDVKPNSDKKVWWKCSKGHEWQAVIAKRNNGNNCPICRKNKGDNLEQRLEIERS